MDTTTGRFTSMDSYLGSVDDPVSLHKYLYANVNPVNYIDPSGYYTLAELETYMTASDSLQITMLKIDLSFLHNVTVSTGAVLLTVDLSRKLVDSMFDEGVSIGDAKKELTDCVIYMAKGNENEKEEVKDNKEDDTKSVEDILDGAKETTNKVGVARNFEKKGGGGYEKTVEDFNKFNPTDVKEIETKYGAGQLGTLKNGKTVVARPGSNTGGATLEVRLSKKKIYKIRY